MLAVAKDKGTIRLGLCSDLHSLWVNSEFSPLTDVSSLFHLSLLSVTFSKVSMSLLQFFVSPSAFLCLWSVCLLPYLLFTLLLLGPPLLSLSLCLSLPLIISLYLSASTVCLFPFLFLSLFWGCSSAQLSQSVSILTAISKNPLFRVDLNVEHQCLSCCEHMGCTHLLCMHSYVHIWFRDGD